MTTPGTLGEALQQHNTALLAQLKPLQEFLAERQKEKEVSPLAALPWQVQMSKGTSSWPEGPKPGQGIVVMRDGSYKLVPAAAIMGQGGGLLGAIEQPVNAIWPALPLGSIAVGAVVGITVGELIDGFIPPKSATGGVNMVNVVAKGGGILALTMFGPQLMSKTGTIIAVGLLGAQLLADLLPLDRLVQAIVNFFRKLFGQAPLAQREVMQEVAPPQGFTGGQRTDLYAGIFGRGG